MIYAGIMKYQSKTKEIDKAHEEANVFPPLDSLKKEIEEYMWNTNKN